MGGKLMVARNNKELWRQQSLAASVAAAAEAAARRVGLPPTMQEVPDHMLAAAVHMLSHKSGIEPLDKAVARGFLLVNTGAYEAAISMFDVLLGDFPNLIAGQLAKGSAYAMSGRFPEAVVSFTAALSVDPEAHDAWKRRAQVQAARGDEFLSHALNDITQAEVLAKGGDPDIYHQRGMIYHRLKDFRSGAKDFRRCLAANELEPVTWNSLGLCLAQLGDVEDAVAAYKRAVELKAEFKEAWLNLAQLHKDAGNGGEALKLFAMPLNLDSSYTQALHLRGQCHYGMGDMARALKDFTRAVELDATLSTCAHLAALCLQSLGEFREAVTRLDALLQREPSHACWYSRECILYYWQRLDRPLVAFNPDDELDPYLKEAQCRRYDPRTHPPLANYVRQGPPTAPLSDLGTPGGSPSSGMVQLVHCADVLGRWVQLDCPGFLANVRQHRQFGLAVISIAQRLRQHWLGLKYSGGAGFPVPNSSASRKGEPLVGPHPAHPGSCHLMEWRDLMDMSVRWRQISEPNDPVWWIDRLAPEAFEEGFGLQTPLVNGQLKVIRYYPYFPRAFRLMKELMASTLQGGEAGDLGRAAGAVLRGAESLAELYSAWGQGDFWVVSPCQSLVEPVRSMEGTRLTVQARPPGGFEFSIRTPGTPHRWREYDEELQALWEKLCAVVVDALPEHPPPNTESLAPGPFVDALLAGGAGAGMGQAQEADTVLRQVADAALKFFFYWVNFGPLSRGSAACGYAAVLGIFTALNIDVTRGVPKGLQMDWEAILRRYPGEFVDSTLHWMHPALHVTQDRDLLGGVPLVDDEIPDLGTALRAMNVPAAVPS
uniref:Protein O-GlcNAc transferase n=1 Tax=Rhizochromulina marina TaxID=1034831 RepID=A0A7S2SK19_9STRA